jgi:hypothetical protein
MPIPNFLEAIRRNHALEHGTVAMLTLKWPRKTLAGHSNPAGFVLYGEVGADDVREAAQEALERLQNGERTLAISPFCGTNMLVTGTLTTLAAIAAMGRENRVSRLPRAIAAATWAVAAAQPIGLMIQSYVTTSTAVHGLEVVSVRRMQRGGTVAHWVRTVDHAPNGSLTLPRADAILGRDSMSL